MTVGDERAGSVHPEHRVGAARSCCGHPDGEHDPDEGCLHGWTATEQGCPCRPEPRAPEPAGLLDTIAAVMAATGATGLRRVAGPHDGRWRRNR